MTKRPNCITCDGAGVIAMAGVPGTISCPRCGGAGDDPEGVTLPPPIFAALGFDTDRPEESNAE